MKTPMIKPVKPAKPKPKASGRVVDPGTAYTIHKLKPLPKRT